MHKLLFVLAVGMLVAGCVSGASSLNDDAELKAYAMCNDRYARQFAAQPGDPYSLAIAAEASCPREKLALLNRYRDARGPGFALSMMRGLERTAIETNTGKIARVRVGA